MNRFVRNQLQDRIPPSTVLEDSTSFIHVALTHVSGYHWELVIHQELLGVHECPHQALQAVVKRVGFGEEG